MKYILAILLIFNIFLNLNGHTYGVMTGNVNNVYYSGDVAGETQYQNQIIAYLCNEYVETYYPLIDEKVFLELRIGEPIFYRLSFDKYQGDRWQFAEHNRPIKGQGIRIRLHQECNRAESILKLLEYGLKNLKKLKKSSEKFYDNPDHYSSNYLSVDTNILFNILNESISHEIESILKKRVYRNLGKTEYNVYKEYYFQNDTFHLIDFMNDDKEYLVTDRIYQIINEYYLGTIIFVTDSTGFFYNREESKLSDKFLIKNKRESYYFVHTSSYGNKRRIYFEYQTYRGYKKKFIYLTDKLMLIQGVEKFEDEFIEKEIEKRI